MKEAHTPQQFDVFMSQLVETNATLDFYSDFKKIAANVETIAIKLNQLNFLIGKGNLVEAVQALWAENPKVFNVLNILIAVRKKDKKKVVDSDGNVKLITDFFTTPEGVVSYITNTGLAEVFRNKQITNLVDYVFGVETGLDTNARKNRSGDIMGDKIAKTFTESGISYRREVNSTEYRELECLGTDRKRFDFVVKTKVRTYLIEVNFYGGGGSKLNEVARAYSELASKINQKLDLEFVWITDGKGWYSARNKLQEAFATIPSIYNLTSLPNFINRLKNEMG